MKIAILKVYSNQLCIKEFKKNDSLDELKKAVGGYIEVIPFYVITKTCPEELNNVLIIIDEEGKIKGKQTNIELPYDDLVGDIVFAGIDRDDIIGLTDNQIQLLQAEIIKIKKI